MFHTKIIEILLLNTIFDLLEEIDIHPTGWQSQNLYFSMAKNRAAMGDKVYDEELKV